jgi:5'-methylthioadenosine phosphorylase
VGTLVIPDDFFNLWTQITFFDDARSHIVPGLNDELRGQIMNKLKEESIPFLPHGTYAQTTGPRFETKAEVRFLGTVADIVGK